MVGNIGQKLGRLRAWFASAENRKAFERALEWALALAWPFVAYQVVFNRYGWKSDYYNRLDESWFALVLLIAMATPLVFRLFSGHGIAFEKRCAIMAFIACAVLLAVKFRPNFGGVTFASFYVPMAFHAAAAFLWLHWRNKKPAPLPL